MGGDKEANWNLFIGEINDEKKEFMKRLRYLFEEAY